MPTVLRIKAFRFFFYANDNNEPPHVHIQRGENLAKFWFAPVRLARSGGFNRSEIMVIQRMIVDNQSVLLEAWDDYFQS